MILSAFTIQPDGTRIAASTYGTDGNLNFKLGEYNNLETVRRAIMNLKNPKFGRALHKGLQVSYDMLLNEDNGARFGIPKSLLVFVMTNIDRAFASQLKKLENVKVIAVGIGSDIVTSDLAALGRRLFTKLPLLDPTSIYFRHSSDYSDLIDAIKTGRIFIYFYFFYIYIEDNI